MFKNCWIKVSCDNAASQGALQQDKPQLPIQDLLVHSHEALEVWHLHSLQRQLQLRTLSDLAWMPSLPSAYYPAAMRHGVCSQVRPQQHNLARRGLPKTSGKGTLGGPVGSSAFSSRATVLCRISTSIHPKRTDMSAAITIPAATASPCSHTPAPAGLKQSACLPSCSLRGFSFTSSGSSNGRCISHVHITP